jgi:hybrid cluster-associated redox disulfide protein
MQITKEMPILEALSLNDGLIPIMQQHGLHCFGCPSSRGKSLEAAAANHGADIDKLVSDMNDFLES